MNNHDATYLFDLEKKVGKLQLQRDALMTALDVVTDAFERTRPIMDDKTALLAMTVVDRARRLLEAVRQT